MFSAFEQNHTITETLKDYIERKLCPLGRPDYAYTVVRKKTPQKSLSSQVTLMSGSISIVPTIFSLLIR